MTEEEREDARWIDPTNLKVTRSRNIINCSTGNEVDLSEVFSTGNYRPTEPPPTTCADWDLRGFTFVKPTPKTPLLESLFKLKPEEKWKGKLGNEYLKRDINSPEDLANKRKEFWQSIDLKYNPEYVLEIGCNAGHNLASFHGDCMGLDINKKAIKEGKKMYSWIEFRQASILDTELVDGFFDLVFTAGLLIHIPPEDIEKAMKEIIRCSKKYVLAIEYSAKEERERPFLGEMGITWERPYNKMFQGLGLKLIEAGFLTKTEGFNNLQYGVFEK